MSENERKYTPGPWRQCQADGDGCCCGLIWSIPADVVVATVPAEDEEAGISFPPEMARANARLIAASPDLLVALEDLLAGAWDPDEDALERFERVADEFYRATGHLRPGKSEASEKRTQERQAAWDGWVLARARERITKARAAIARATGGVL